MSQENVELVRQAIEAWNRGDLDAMLQVIDPEVEMTPVIAQLVEGDAVYRGIPGARRFWEDWRIAWNFQWEIGALDLRDVGDSVIMIARASLTSQTSGMELDAPMGVVFTLRNGRVLRVTSHLDPAEALEAAGLSE
jgi:ketosteroid isomerase-like protein